MGACLNKPVIGKNRQSPGCYMDRADLLVATNAVLQVIFGIIYMAGVAGFIGALSDLVDFVAEQLGEADQADQLDGYIRGFSAALYVVPVLAWVVSGISLLFTFTNACSRGCKVYSLMCCVPWLNVAFGIAFAAFAVGVNITAFVVRQAGSVCSFADESLDQIREEYPEYNDIPDEDIETALGVCLDMSSGISLMQVGVVLIELTLVTAIIVSCIRGASLRSEKEGSDADWNSSPSKEGSDAGWNSNPSNPSVQQNGIAMA